MSLTSDFLVCVFLFVCFGVYARERLWEPILWVEEKPPIFSCFVFASGSCLKALGAQAFCLASAGSQREERTEWRVSGLPNLAVKGRAGFGMVFQSHSYLELCQDGDCGLVEDSYAVHEAWRWASAAHMLYWTYFLGSSAQIPQRENNLPGCFHTHIRASESLFLAVRLAFLSVYKDTCVACLFLLKSAAPVGGAWL